MQHEGSSSWTTDRTWALCIGSMESQPLNHEGSPLICFSYIKRNWLRISSPGQVPLIRGHVKGTVGKRVGQCVEGVQGWVSRCETPSHRLHVVVERLNGGGGVGNAASWGGDWGRSASLPGSPIEGWRRRSSSLLLSDKPSQRLVADRSDLPFGWEWGVGEGRRLISPPRGITCGPSGAQDPLTR